MSACEHYTIVLPSASLLCGMEEIQKKGEQEVVVNAGSESEGEREVECEGSSSAIYNAALGCVRL